VNRVFLKDQVNKLQAAASTQIFQVYPLFVLFGLFLCQMKLSAGSAERWSWSDALLQEAPMLEGGGWVSWLNGRRHLLHPPGSYVETTSWIQHKIPEPCKSKDLLLAQVFEHSRKCSKSIAWDHTRWDIAFSLWVRMFCDPLSTLSPKTYSMPVDTKNGFLSWWNLSASSLLLVKTSSCWTSSQHKPWRAIATLNNFLLGIYVLSQVLSCAAIYTHVDVLKHRVKPGELICCA